MKAGQIRRRKGFLFFPKEIGGEIRWLEYAHWIEEFDPGYPMNMWNPIRWDSP